jgi:hypothetical protein
MSNSLDAVIPEGVPLGVLASALQADQNGTMRRELMELFTDASSEARRRLHEPLTPQDHDATAALAKAASECTEVIDAVWNALHP